MRNVKRTLITLTAIMQILSFSSQPTKGFAAEIYNDEEGNSLFNAENKAFEFLNSKKV